MTEIAIYQNPDGDIQLQVQIEQDNVWLTQKQMAELFGTEIPAISKHIKNIFKTKELSKKETVSKMEIVQIEGKHKVSRNIEHYNLDMIISVGYRINSKQGTQFRKWATEQLRALLTKGYAIREEQLQQDLATLQQLKNTIKLVEQSIHLNELTQNEAQGLLHIISLYNDSLVTLNQYDAGRLSEGGLSEDITYEINYQEGYDAVMKLKSTLMKQKEASDLFGNEKDNGFKSALGAVTQTFGGNYLYPSIEQQAANMLYLIVKNHPFSDGNKRIGAFLFVWFLEKNRHLHGYSKINQQGLVALTLLVAQSNPADKEMMIKLIINLIKAEL